MKSATAAMLRSALQASRAAPLGHTPPGLLSRATNTFAASLADAQSALVPTPRASGGPAPAGARHGTEPGRDSESPARADVRAATAARSSSYPVVVPAPATRTTRTGAAPAVPASQGAPRSAAALTRPSVERSHASPDVGGTFNELEVDEGALHAQLDALLAERRADRIGVPHQRGQPVNQASVAFADTQATTVPAAGGARRPGTETSRATQPPAPPPGPRAPSVSVHSSSPAASSVSRPSQLPGPARQGSRLPTPAPQAPVAADSSPTPVPLTSAASTPSPAPALATAAGPADTSSVSPRSGRGSAAPPPRSGQAVVVPPGLTLRPTSTSGRSEAPQGASIQASATRPSRLRQGTASTAAAEDASSPAPRSTAARETASQSAAADKASEPTRRTSEARPPGTEAFFAPQGVAARPVQVLDTKPRVLKGTSDAHLSTSPHLAAQGVVSRGRALSETLRVGTPSEPLAAPTRRTGALDTTPEVEPKKRSRLEEVPLGAPPATAPPREPPLTTQALQTPPASELPAAVPQALEPFVSQLTEDPSARLVLNANTARLSVDAGESGRLSVQLKVTDGVAELTASGPAAPMLDARQNELRVALAHEGLALGRFDLGHQGHQHQERPADAREAPEPRRPAPSGHGPTTTSATAEPSRRTGGIHVKA